ncbi:MAG: hypothetical protein ACYTDY_10320 [Planctomycetota bacterium]|jgi:hypothetical protein
MDHAETLLPFLEAELGRVACSEVRLVEVTKERDAAFERGLDVIWCDAEAARRALFVLPSHAGDDATWLALQLIGRTRLGRERRDP